MTEGGRKSIRHGERWRTFTLHLHPGNVRRMSIALVDFVWLMMMMTIHSRKNYFHFTFEFECGITLKQYKKMMFEFLKEFKRFQQARYRLTVKCKVLLYFANSHAKPYNISYLIPCNWHVNINIIHDIVMITLLAKTQSKHFT